mmetsp:Transcript_2329/g.4818  ORF Transcript_2329/g.4818 Transcript_2329/m.4818 type:complete len:180 (+) Transcript_2329:276-815(+)
MSTATSTEMKPKLPLLPSERLRERLRNTDEDESGDIYGESNELGLEKSGGDEILSSPGTSSPDTEVSDTVPTSLDRRGLPSAEEERKQRERVRQYQEKAFGSQPPLPVSTTSRALQDVLLSTSQFVNSFVADADSRLEISAAEISALERQVGLLEGKLASVAVSNAADGDQTTKSASRS